MKITFLAPHIRIAGGVRAILTYADRLAGRGHDVTVLVPAKRPWRAWTRNLRGQGPDWIPGFRSRVRWVTSWNAARLPAADALIATAWQTADTAATAPARCGAKFYFVQHFESLYHGDPQRVDATYGLPLRKIVISSWLREIMKERFGADAEVLVTPVDRDLFHPVEGARSDDALRVLMLHHDYAWKGVREGLEAVAAVKLRHPRIRLVGFGVKRPRETLPYDEFHENLPQERLAWLYSRCSIYLCPSWDEGLGMPSMEAMACGAALVTFDNGGSRDYATDGATALVAPRRDVAALARCLERMVADGALRERIAARGREFVTQSFDWDRAAARLEKILGSY
ncbi:MAG TPA: glycosyltransferase family 4 protein [Terriglobales bacterium]|nr:glycosyltransferase family 4 protein [Terriglobales bacterium]